MSEDVVKIYFSAAGCNKKAIIHRRKLLGLFSRNHDVQESGLCEFNSERYDFGVYIKFDFEEVETSKTLLAALKYVEKYASDSKPYIELEFDQVNDKEFYVLCSNKIVSFEHLDDLNAFLEKNYKSSVEHEFYESLTNNDEMLFVRLKFRSKKVAKGVDNLANAYIADRTDTKLNNFKTYIDDELNKAHIKLSEEPDLNVHIYDFPNYTNKSTNRYYAGSYNGPQGILETLSFSSFDEEYLFLAFKFDGVTEYCPGDGEYGESEFPTGKQLISHMLDNINNLTKDQRAKVISPKLGELKEGIYYPLGATESVIYFDRDKIHPCVW